MIQQTRRNILISTQAMTACVRRFGMRNLAVKKLRAVVATCRDETARARHARLELFAVLLGLTPAHKSNCHGASIDASPPDSLVDLRTG